MPTKAYIKKSPKKTTKTVKTTNGKNWISQFNSHITSNASNFGWTKSQVNAFCQAFAAWEKAFNCFQNNSGTWSATPVKKSTPKKSTSTKSKGVSKTSSAPKSIRTTRTNWKKNSTRNYKVAA